MSTSKPVKSGSDSNGNDSQKDLRAEIIRNLFKVGVALEHIAELMNMPEESVSEYLK